MLIHLEHLGGVKYGVLKCGNASEECNKCQKDRNNWDLFENLAGIGNIIQVSIYFT